MSHWGAGATPSLPRSCAPLPQLWSGGRLCTNNINLPATNAVIYHPRQGNGHWDRSIHFMGLFCRLGTSGRTLFCDGHFEKAGKWGFPTWNGPAPNWQAKQQNWQLSLLPAGRPKVSDVRHSVSGTEAEGKSVTTVAAWFSVDIRNNLSLKLTV